MDYASPAVQLLGLMVSLLIGILSIVASAILLRERTIGAWMMLTGSVLSLVGTILPQGIYVLEMLYAGYKGSIFEIMPQLQSVMYLTVWNWLAVSAWLLFVFGLVLVALRRRGLTKRIAELEMLLAAQDQDHQ